MVGARDPASVLGKEADALRFEEGEFGRGAALVERSVGAGDPVAAVRELTGGLGADVVLECAGVPDTLTWAMAMLRRGGRCAMVGIPTEDVALAIQPLVLDELELVGSRASAGEMRRVMPFVANGRMRVGELITHSFPLSEYEKALAVFNDRSSGAIKIIIHP